MTQEQINNLKKLALYLAFGNLQAGFDMTLYDREPITYTPDGLLANGEGLNSCGTVGCAIGHGPYAGIEKLKGDSWLEYAEKAFGINASLVDEDADMPFRWLFDCEWCYFDNTPEGAAKRIVYFLVFGIPSTFKEPDKHSVLLYESINLRTLLL